MYRLPSSFGFAHFFIVICSLFLSHFSHYVVCVFLLCVLFLLVFMLQRVFVDVVSSWVCKTLKSFEFFSFRYASFLLLHYNFSCFVIVSTGCITNSSNVKHCPFHQKWIPGGFQYVEAIWVCSLFVVIFVVFVFCYVQSFCYFLTFQRVFVVLSSQIFKVSKSFGFSHFDCSSHFLLHYNCSYGYFYRLHHKFFLCKASFFFPNRKVQWCLCIIIFLPSNIILIWSSHNLYCFAKSVKYDVVYPFIFAKSGLHDVQFFWQKWISQCMWFWCVGSWGHLGLLIFVVIHIVSFVLHIYLCCLPFVITFTLTSLILLHRGFFFYVTYVIVSNFYVFNFVCKFLNFMITTTQGWMQGIVGQKR